MQGVLMLHTQRTCPAIFTAIALVLQCCPMERVAAQTSTLKATLNSEQAGPYPADPDGSGTVRLELSTDADQLCYELHVSDIESATSAHLHQASSGRIGPIRLQLDPPTDGAAAGCTHLDPDLLHALVATPGDFYIDVHNAAYPGGAVRGQLGS